MTDQDRADIAALLLEGRLRELHNQIYPRYELRVDPALPGWHGAKGVYCVDLEHVLMALRGGRGAWVEYHCGYGLRSQGD